MSAALCANCPVWTGACPACGTFWVAKQCCPNHRAKRYGVRPTNQGFANGPTNGYYALQTLPNVVRP